MNIIFPDNVRKCIKLQTNWDWSLYTDMPEAFYLDKYFRLLAPPVVLDLGCGVGRASVYFFKKYGWRKTLFYLADGNTCEKCYKGKRKNSGEFYNLKSATTEFCEANGLYNYTYHNLESHPLSSIDCQFDLVYSFLAIGFHWPIGMYLQGLYEKCVKGALVIFGIRYDPTEPWIEKQIDSIDCSKFKIRECAFCSRESRHSVLILEAL